MIRHLPHDRCRACGFSFANPYPPATVCRQFYNSGFYSNYSTLEAIDLSTSPGKFFGEIAKLVRPGGRVLITTNLVDNLLGPATRSYPHTTRRRAASACSLPRQCGSCSRFSFTPVHLATDKKWGVTRTVALSLSYKRDYASPQHDEDTNDALFVPTRLGRWRGRTPTRTPTLGRLVSGLTSLADRVVARVFPRPHHIYVVAEQHV